MLWSFEIFTTLMAQAAAAVCSIVLYVLLVAQILPRLLLTPRFDASLAGDRGIRRFVFEGGRAIVYEPSAMYRKYVSQYILSAVGERKYIRCRFARAVRSARYDVVVFDAFDRAIGTVRIEEPLSDGNGNLSRAALLPDGTAYAKLIVRAVNDTLVASETAFVLSARRKALFISCVTLGLVAEAMLLRWVLVSFADRLFSYSEISLGYGGVFAAVSALAIGLGLSFLLCHFYKTEEKEKPKRKSRRA